LKHQNEEPTSLFKLRPEVPHALADICRRMMTKSRDERIQTAAQVAEELSTWLAARGKQSAYLKSQSVGLTRSAAGDSAKRWLPRSSSGAPPLPKEATPPGRHSRDDTVSSAHGDTSRIGITDSSVNDNLTLAPLEEEKKPAPEIPQAESKKSSPNLKEQGSKSSASAVNPTELREYESGPLDSLLKDKRYSQSAKFSRQLALKKEKSKAPMIMLITILTLFGMAVLVLIITIIVTST
jgi:hypothetical protein